MWPNVSMPFSVNILLFDNYDSFTYNLADYLSMAGASLQVIRNDDYTAEQLSQLSFDAAVLSPGPSTPLNAGQLMPFIETWCKDKPMLGVCLGFQALGMHFGAELTHSKLPVHGKTSTIRCTAHAMYEGIPVSHKVCRYHSLQLADLPGSLELTAVTGDGLPMAFSHREFPIWAVQYHPEAILTEYGHEYIRNWMKMARARA